MLALQAALDVFAKEPPPPDHPLVGRPEVVCTPHLGASTTEAQEGVALEIAQAVVEALQVHFTRPYCLCCCCCCCCHFGLCPSLHYKSLSCLASDSMHLCHQAGVACFSACPHSHCSCGCGTCTGLLSNNRQPPMAAGCRIRSRAIVCPQKRLLRHLPQQPSARMHIRCTQRTCSSRATNAWWITGSKQAAVCPLVTSSLSLRFYSSMVLQGELAPTAVNAPMVPAAVLKELQPFVTLAAGLGRTAVQVCLMPHASCSCLAPHWLPAQVLSTPLGLTPLCTYLIPSRCMLPCGHRGIIAAQSVTQADDSVPDRYAGGRQQGAVLATPGPPCIAASISRLHDSRNFHDR